MLRTCDHGWSSLLQMQTSHIDPRSSCTRAQIHDCSKGQGEAVSCSNCDFIKISARLSGMSRAAPFTSCTIPPPPPHPKSPKTKEENPLHCQRFLTVTVTNTSSAFSQRQTQICCFHLITSFHLSFILHSAVTQPHVKLTLQRYLTWDANKKHHTGLLQDAAAASHVCCINIT